MNLRLGYFAAVAYPARQPEAPFTRPRLDPLAHPRVFLRDPQLGMNHRPAARFGWEPLAVHYWAELDGAFLTDHAQTPQPSQATGSISHADS